MATTLAGRIVGESLEDDKRQQRTVERFIADLEADESDGSGQSEDSGSSEEPAVESSSSGGR